MKNQQSPSKQEGEAHSSGPKTEKTADLFPKESFEESPPSSLKVDILKSPSADRRRMQVASHPQPGVSAAPVLRPRPPSYQIHRATKLGTQSNSVIAPIPSSRFGHTEPRSITSPESARTRSRSTHHASQALDEASDSPVAPGRAPSLASPYPNGRTSPPNPNTRPEGQGALASESRQFRYHEVLGGKYRLEKSLARGGMGWVFLATQLPLGREVAIKILMPQPNDSAFRDRFLLEASTCAKLSHPNIVTIHDYGESPEGDLFMTMEYLDGLSLSQTISQEGYLSPEWSIRIAVEVARALRAAHRAGVIHRDLKPSNIMLVKSNDSLKEQDVVKVVDFGLAKLLNPQDTVAPLDLTREGVLLGSPRYMAPEQIRHHEVDPRTDIYAFGIILYFMLAGRPPFDGDNSTDILTQHLRDLPLPIQSINPLAKTPPELEILVQKCLAKTPSNRYQTIDELLIDLASVINPTGRSSMASAIFSGEFAVNPFEIRSNDLPSVDPQARATVSGEHNPPLYSEAQWPDISNESDNAGAWWALALILSSIIGTLVFWTVILG